MAFSRPHAVTCTQIHNTGLLSGRHQLSDTNFQSCLILELFITEVFVCYCNIVTILSNPVLCNWNLNDSFFSVLARFSADCKQLSQDQVKVVNKLI